MSELTGARENLVRAALRYLSAERVDYHAHFADDLELAEEQIDEAARQLTARLQRSNPEQRP